MALKKIFGVWLILCGSAFAQTISNVYVQSSTATTATIVWTTSIPATSQIKYGYDSSLPYSNNVNYTLVTSHSMTLTILNAIQPYYFAVVSGAVQSPTYEFALCGQPQVPVSGTINQFYYDGTYTLTWNPPAGAGGTPTVCGQGVQTTVTGSLNLLGSFSSQVADSMKVTPGPGTWTVTVADIGDISPVSVTLPLSTLTQDISTQLQAAAAGTSLVGVIANNNSQKVYPPWIGTGGGGTPGGTNGQVQYNDLGGFGGYASVPLAFGGTDATTAAGAESSLLANPAASTASLSDYAVFCSSTSSCVPSLTGWVTNMDFGAKCDTVLNSNFSFASGTDDTAANQAALNSGAIGVILCPNGGSTMISSPISSPGNVTVVGLGRLATYIVYTGTSTGPIFEANSATTLQAFDLINDSTTSGVTAFDSGGFNRFQDLVVGRNVDISMVGYVAMYLQGDDTVDNVITQGIVQIYDATGTLGVPNTVGISNSSIHDLHGISFPQNEPAIIVEENQGSTISLVNDSIIEDGSVSTSGSSYIQFASGAESGTLNIIGGFGPSADPTDRDNFLGDVFLNDSGNPQTVNGSAIVNNLNGSYFGGGNFLGLVTINGAPYQNGLPFSTNDLADWTNSGVANGNVPVWNSGTGKWTPGGGGGGDTITSPNGTLSVGGSSTNTTLDLNLANVNTWLANQNHTGTTDTWQVASPSNPEVAITNTGITAYDGVSARSILTSAHLSTPAVLDTGAAAPSTDIYCVQIDDTGLLSNTGAPCGSSSGSGTVTASPQYDVAYYTQSGTTAQVGGVAISGIQKDSTSGAPVAATAGTDYVIPSGNVATATNLASYPSLCSGGQFSQGLSSGSNNCGTPSGSGTVTDGAGTTTALQFPESTSTAHVIQYRTPTQALGDMGAAPALPNATDETASWSIVANNNYRFTGSSGANATTPATTGATGVSRFINAGTANVTVVTGGPTLVCIPASCVIQPNQSAIIYTDGTDQYVDSASGPVIETGNSATPCNGAVPQGICTFTLSSADLLAFDGTSATHVTAISAPGAGKMLTFPNPIGSPANYIFNSLPFSAPLTLWGVYPIDDSFYVSSWLPDTSQSSNQVGLSGSDVFVIPLNGASSGFVNSPFWLYGTTLIKNGIGTFTIAVPGTGFVTGDQVNDSTCTNVGLGTVTASAGAITAIAFTGVGNYPGGGCTVSTGDALVAVSGVGVGASINITGLTADGNGSVVVTIPFVTVAAQ